MDDAFGNWLAGLADGEGSFNIYSRRNGVSSLIFYGCMFTLKLRHDDRPVLDEICRATGIGGVTDRPARKRSKPVSQWRVSSKNDCLKLIEIFDRYRLRAKKRRDYAVWREAVLLWADQRHGVGSTGPLQERTKFAALKVRLQSTRAYRAAA